MNNKFNEGDIVEWIFANKKSKIQHVIVEVLPISFFRRTIEYRTINNNNEKLVMYEGELRLVDSQKLKTNKEKKE